MDCKIIFLFLALSLNFVPSFSGPSSNHPLEKEINTQIHQTRLVEAELCKQRAEINKLKIEQEHRENEKTRLLKDINDSNEEQTKLAKKQKDGVSKLELELREMEELYKDLEELKKQQRGDPNYPKTDWQQNEMFENYLNIGMIGAGRVGKSCFVNTIRGIKNQQDVVPPVIWAPTDSGKECTLVATRYVLNPKDIDPKFDDSIINIWDMPGYGTQQNPNNTYIKNQGLKYFDVVLFFSSNVFSDEDENIIGELNKHKIPFMLVRNKIDQLWKQALTEQELWLNGRQTKNMSNDYPDYDKTNRKISELYVKMTKKTYDPSKEAYYKKCQDSYTNLLESLNSDAIKKLETKELFCISSEFDNHKLYDYEKFLSDIQVKIKAASDKKQEFLAKIKAFHDKSTEWTNKNKKMNN